VVAVTDGIRDRLVSGKGVPANKVLFLPNGVDTARFRPFEPGTGNRSTQPPVLAYIGTLGLAHGLDVVLEAAAIAPEIHFLLVGDGSEKARLMRHASDRGLSNVEFRDPVPPSEVAVLYASAEAGLSTLRRSQFMEGVRPAKVLAIMACARPVVYAGAGEGADMVRAADAGVVIAPEDPEALAAAARSIVADRAQAARLGANGRAYVEQHFAWARLVEDWLGQLDAVLRTRPS
jgi:glycosyltransferase involved in cell wall biosynthesis